MKSNLKVKMATMAAFLLVGFLPAGAQETVQISVTGRVLPAYSLEPVAVAADANQIVSVERLAQGQVLIRLHPQSPSSGAKGTVRVILALRTNAESYRLRAASSGLQVEVGQPEASGSFVVPGALSSFSGQPTSGSDDQEQVVATGTRISLRGRFTSPNNALLVPLELRCDSGASSGSCQVLVTLGS